MLAILAPCLLGLALVGCASEHRSVFRGAQRVDLAEFARSPGAGDERHVTDGSGRDTDTDNKPDDGATNVDRYLSAGSDAEELAAAAVSSRAAPVGNEQPLLVEGDEYIVDSLVGQINGRPIFADAFFEPIEDQLIQLRRRTNEREFAREAAEIISSQLWLQARDELLLTQAEASLSPEERQGLFAFMRYIREREISMAGGTRAGAEERLLAGEGMTIEDYTRSQLDQQLVAKLVREEIMPHVIVSWRDVQRAYRQRHAEFNPPPTLHLSRIYLRADNAEAIQTVEESLKAGQPFEEIAAALGQEGVWQSFEIGEDGLHDIGLAEPITEALRGLEIGEATDRIDIGSSAMWLHLESLDEQQRSIYELDVQRALMRELRSQRMREEEARYFSSLFDGGVQEKLNLIRLRLLEIAMHRYGNVES